MEPKSRAKRIDNGQLVYGYYVKHITRQVCPIGDTLTDDDVAHYIVQSGFADWNMPRQLEFIKIAPTTRSQFIGILDKHGVEIYEGDTVRLHQFLFDGNEYDNELIGTVVWDDIEESSGGPMVCWSLTDIKNPDLSRYCGYDTQEDFSKVKFPICLFIGLHEETFEVIGTSYSK